MDHVDEGTIHAWLDQALSPHEGARVEAHIADCAACAAAVAEARGLIAASSRILSALDDVPGGVIPESGAVHTPAADAVRGRDRNSAKAPGGVASQQSAVRASRSGRRPWWQRPQLAAAAGIAFVAVSAGVVWQRGGAPVFSDQAESAASAVSAAAEAAAPALADRMASVSAESAGPMAMTAVRERPASEAKSKGRPAEARARRAMAANAPSLADESGERESVRRDARPGTARPAGGGPPQVAATSGAGAATETGAAPRPVAAAMPAPPPSPAAAAASADSTNARQRSRSQPDSLARPPERLSISADAITRSERARLAGERDAAKASAPLNQTTATGASSFVSAVAENLVGCYRATLTDSARAIGVGEVVELTIEGSAFLDGQRAHEARMHLVVAWATPLADGEVWRWRPGQTGEVVLVRTGATEVSRVTLVVGPSPSPRPAALGESNVRALRLTGSRRACPVTR